ncbi:MAG: Stp1/IreP family PP2C-type Ser/Thr phosphatase [Clostridiales bacterium]|nr:Stp1/IreP family PP2C-type Ser/Thr phosphatase [Clostridiales bacterium]
MKISSATDIGLARSENQDIVRVDELFDNVLAVICDGMGGERSGEKASKIAIDAIFDKFVGEYQPTFDVTNIKTLLISAVNEANSQVYNSSRKDCKDFGMGTTCVAAFITKDRIHISNVGDSRAYILEGDGLKQITKDHTFARMLFERGDIIEEEIKSHPNRNMLTKAVGVEKSITPDYFEINHEEGFKLMLCSDGLSGYCSSEEMFEILNDNDVEVAARELIKLAISKGGRDNITLAIIAD